MSKLEKRLYDTIRIAGLSFIIGLGSFYPIDFTVKEIDKMFENKPLKLDVRYSYMLSRLAYSELMIKAGKGILTKEEEIRLMIKINSGYLLALNNSKGLLDEPKLWNELGEIMQLLGQHEDAKLYFKKALDLDKGNKDLYENSIQIIHQNKK